MTTIAVNGPGLAVFDGSNVWVTQRLSNSVTKIRASDGQVLGSFAAGPEPIDVAQDGTNLWVTNYTARTITKLRLTDGATLGTFSGFDEVQWRILYLNGNLWINNWGGTVRGVRASDLSTVCTFTVEAAGGVSGLATDGTFVFTGHWASSRQRGEEDPTFGLL